MARKTFILATMAALALAGAALAQPPAGWMLAGSHPAQYEAGVEPRGSGKAAFVRAKAANAEGFGTLMQTVSAAPYRGKRVRLSALLKTTGARRAQMWMRVDGHGPANTLSFDNMDSRPITG